MENINTKMEFIKAFSKFSGVTQKDTDFFITKMSEFIEQAVEEQVSIKINGLFEIYYSRMKSRDTVKVGSKEKITLPATRKARMRLAQKFRLNQKAQNRIYRKVLEEDLPLTD